MIEHAKLARSLHIYRVHFDAKRSAMTPEFAEIAIITMAFSTTLGYLIGIINYLVEAKKSEKNFTLPLV